MTTPTGQAVPTERSVLETLADVVGTDVSEIDLDDDLTDHGLDSVRLMVLVERWRAQGHAIEFATVAASPTARTCLEALGVPRTT